MLTKHLQLFAVALLYVRDGKCLFGWEEIEKLQGTKFALKDTFYMLEYFLVFWLFSQKNSVVSQFLFLTSCFYSNPVILQCTVYHNVNVECGVLCEIEQLYSVFCLIEHEYSLLHVLCVEIQNVSVRYQAVHAAWQRSTPKHLSFVLIENPVITFLPH